MHELQILCEISWPIAKALLFVLLFFHIEIDCFRFGRFLDKEMDAIVKAIYFWQADDMGSPYMKPQVSSAF